MKKTNIRYLVGCFLPMGIEPMHQIVCNADNEEQACEILKSGLYNRVCEEDKPSLRYVAKEVSQDFKI
ncbi:hypothetical protein [Salmonirosea aquatica]|uniref:Uncharacterized protein n=1 Tax=Salmonirosea aquatica TaxID=2654236 RepID=A0A7C9BFQ0_9BACT|nr:hypothetical protein [Cytophagaceae bacterium SJW1-29]